ncbi:MAG: methylenetetrahydrofolate reductase [NAD(P)H] [Lachnospiraceae bacterium]|nr:methylenetetrahydrofolate reductase [NAD(P)H] [Lachnospiraceae bacterium]
MKETTHLSFEVFPPKKDSDFSSVYEVVTELAKLSPEYISVTYGAGGSQSKKTTQIASYIQNELNVPAVAHMTCVGSTKSGIAKLCEELKAEGVSNILALRGDRPKDMTDEQYNLREFTYSTDLIAELKKMGDFHIMAACYPEKHFEAFSKEADLKHMKEKQDLGAEHFITQLFFDNDFFYDFRERADKKGITAPIHAGIMPITSAKQIGTSISLSGSSVPKMLSDIIAKYADKPEDMFKAGIDYAIRQIRDLEDNGVYGVHIYTMNKPAIASEIVKAI